LCGFFTFMLTPAKPALTIDAAQERESVKSV
jgi:hypothetical protein